LRFAGEHLRHLFPFLPQQPGYNKRLRRLAAGTDGAHQRSRRRVISTRSS